MKKVWKWLLVFAAVFLGILLVIVPVFLHFGGVGNFARYPMTAWSAHHGMVGLHTAGAYSMLTGGGSMFGMILLPLLLVLGLYLLFRERTAPQAQQSLDKACLHCGRLLQTDWTTCPYCGEKSDQE